MTVLVRANSNLADRPTGVCCGHENLNDCISGRPKPVLAPRPSMIYCASLSISTIQESYTSNEVQDFTYRGVLILVWLNKVMAQLAKLYVSYSLGCFSHIGCVLLIHLFIGPFRKWDCPGHEELRDSRQLIRYGRLGVYIAGSHYQTTTR
jgi:hypothetical protein